MLSTSYFHQLSFISIRAITELQFLPRSLSRSCLVYVHARQNFVRWLDPRQATLKLDPYMQLASWRDARNQDANRSGNALLSSLASRTLSLSLIRPRGNFGQMCSAGRRLRGRSARISSRIQIEAVAAAR